MKSKFLLFLLSFMLVKISGAQEISKSDIVKFKIRSIMTIESDGVVRYTEFYNDKGDFIKQGSPDDNKQLQITRQLFYDDSSKLIEEHTYSGKGEINTITKYYYNCKNQLFKREDISSGEISDAWTFAYDERGNKTSETQTSGTMGKSLTVYKYDDKNFLVQEDKSSNSNGKEERINYKYNDKGQVIEKKTKTYYFNTTITLTYLYSDTGRLAKLLEKSSNGVSSTTIYDYDDKGLLISETWESSISKTPHKTTYQVNYW